MILYIYIYIYIYIRATLFTMILCSCYQNNIKIKLLCFWLICLNNLLVYNFYSGMYSPNYFWLQGFWTSNGKQRLSYFHIIMAFFTSEATLICLCANAHPYADKYLFHASLRAHEERNNLDFCKVLWLYIHPKLMNVHINR